MKENELIKILNDNEGLNNKIKFFLKIKKLRKQTLNEQELRGHIEKAEHNLNFVKDTLDKEYSDWAIVGCYYSIYHIALALILIKGYYSKNHDATLCTLIKEYYKKELTEEEIKMLNIIYLDNEDILFYANSKDQRENASYSTQISFDKKSIESLREKTLLFVRKANDIINKNTDFINTGLNK